MTIKSEYQSKTEEDTISIAKEFSKILNRNTIVYVEGQVGSGKTFFINEIAYNFGIKNLCSSTYTLVNQYHGNINIIHCDFYRLNYISEEFTDDIFEILKQPWLLFIEWPIKILNIPCETSYIVKIICKCPSSRIFRFDKLI